MTDHHLSALPKGYRLQEYELVRVLGHGGFGITYLGHDHNLDKAVAVKEYLPTELAGRAAEYGVAPQVEEYRADFAWELERFLDEARTLAQFAHPNIIQVHRFFEAHDTAYIVMEYVEGETLAERLKRQGALSEDELKSVLLPLLDGLAQVHAAGVLHRDIKPGNIMLRETDGSPVLVDFGSARQATGEHSRSMTAVVTPGYGPIEQYSTRAGRQGPWTDLYALGGVCYRALTGNAPEEATERVRDDPQEPAADTARDKAGAPFLKAIDWALQVDEDERPQDAAAWREALLKEEAATGVVNPHQPAEDVTAPAHPPATAHPPKAQAPAATPSLSAGSGCAIPFFIAALLLLVAGFIDWATVAALAGVVVLLGAAGTKTATPDNVDPEALAGTLTEDNAAAETIRALIARGADLNAKDNFGLTLLHNAARDNKNPKVIQALLDGGADVNAKASGSLDEKTPLHYAAAYNKNPAVIDALITGGANVNAKDELGQTPLHRAADKRSELMDRYQTFVDRMSGNAADEDGWTPLHMLNTLLTNGADVHATDENGWTPLHTAAESNENPEIIQALLGAGANLNAMDGHSGGTPLHWAAAHNENPAVIQTLLAAGANLNAMDRHSASAPLHWAAAHNENPAVLQTLLAAGADANAKDKNGFTPLYQAAVSNESRAVIERLLAASAPVKVTGKLSKIPLYQAAMGSTNPAVIQALLIAHADASARGLLHVAAVFGEQSKIIEALLGAGADANASNANGETPLHRAARFNGNPEIIQALLDGGADMKTKASIFDYTPLHRAARFNGNPEIIQALLDGGADVNAKAGTDETTPLHAAAENSENPEIIQALLDGGADANAKAGGLSDGGTPLHKAAENNENPNIIKALLDGGAYLRATDGRGKTPLDLARKEKNWGAAQVLEESGR